MKFFCKESLTELRCATKNTETINFCCWVISVCKSVADPHNASVLRKSLCRCLCLSSRFRTSSCMLKLLDIKISNAHQSISYLAPPNLSLFRVSCDSDPALQSGEHQWHSTGSMLHPAPTCLPPDPIQRRPTPSIPLPWPRGVPRVSAERPPQQPGALLVCDKLHRT